MIGKLAGACLAAAMCAALAACDMAATSRSPFKGVDVTGAALGRELSLTDHNGQPRSLQDFRGKVVVVTFGYTQCPDVCPTTLQDIAAARKKLGPDASRVQVLFVTVDPKRDKPALLKEYVPAFDPSFLGLYGDAAATKKATNEFKIYAEERPGKTADTYTVDHTAQTFVFDPQGKLRLVESYPLTADALASDMKVLLNAG